MINNNYFISVKIFIRLKNNLLFLTIGLFLSANTSFAQNVEVDEMPYFAGCDMYKMHSKEKLECSMSNLAYYLNRHLVYPDAARQKGISGVVYVTFTVAENGAVSNAKVLNDIGEGCGDMAKKVVSEMPNWEAAVYKEKKVAYELRLPIQFLLDGDQQLAKNYDFFWGNLNSNDIEASNLEKYVKQPIVVRNSKGEQISPVDILLVYENGRTLRNAKGRNTLNNDMIKIIRHAKPGGKLTFSTTLEQKATFFELYKTFNIK